MTDLSIQNASKIKDFAFSGFKINSLTLSDNVKTIGQESFKRCSKLKELNIPDTVEHIYREAFSGCDKLTSVTLGKGISTIEREVFKNCFGLKEVRINNSNLSTICEGSFFDCNILTDIYFSGTISAWKKIDKQVNWNAFVNKDCKVHCLDGELSVF